MNQTDIQAENNLRVLKNKQVNNFLSGSSFQSGKTFKESECSSKYGIDFNLLKQGQEDRISINSSSKASYIQSDKGHNDSIKN